ncbi:carboxymuconolactone decarboxylase family protein [Rohdeia mirabilis]|uniref:carboxymuconolactone decarboxylase family protein n=1 Tax=Rohdeia mirabilis TaxID=2528008 RepID=UPI003AF3AD80
MSRIAPLELLVDLSIAVCRGDWDALLALRAVRPPDRRFREALLQLHLFVGFPQVVEAFGRLERAGGVGAPSPEESELEPDLPDRGRELFRRIYGDHAARVEQALGSHPQLHGWVLGHAYGRVLTRGGLATFERELLAVTALCLRGPARQLASHLRGALACGATRAELEELLTLLEGRLGPTAEHLSAARQALERLPLEPEAS